MHNNFYYWTRTLVRFVFWGGLALIPYVALPTVSGFYIFAAECAIAAVFIMVRFPNPKTPTYSPTDTPIYDELARKYGDPLKK